MLLRLLPLVLLFGTTGALAQNLSPNYVVTTAGDTLRGQIRRVSKHKDYIRLFRQGQGTTQFSAAEVHSYGSRKGLEAVSRVAGPRGRRQFVVPQVEGPVGLFSGENEKQDKRFYLQVPDSAYLIEIAPLSYQLDLARQMGDCPALDFGSNAFRQRYLYSHKGLSNVVLAYNRCRTPEAASYLAKHDAGLRTTWGVKGGFHRAQFDITVPAYTTNSPTGVVGYQAGLMLNMYGRSPFSLQMEALCTALRGDYGQFDLRIYNSGSPTNTVTTSVQYRQVQVPLLVRYSVGHGAFRPYVNGGGVVAMNFNNSSRTSFPLAQMPDVSIEAGRLSYGAAAGAGIWLKLPALPALTAELRYSKFANDIEKQDFFAYNVVTSRLLGIDLGVLF